MHLQNKAEWWPAGRLSCSTAKFNVGLIYWGLIVVCRCHRRPVQTFQTPMWFYATNQWVCVYMRPSSPFKIFYSSTPQWPLLFYMSQEAYLSYYKGRKSEKMCVHNFVSEGLRDLDNFQTPTLCKSWFNGHLGSKCSSTKSDYWAA